MTYESNNEIELNEALEGTEDDTEESSGVESIAADAYSQLGTVPKAEPEDRDIVLAHLINRDQPPQRVQFAERVTERMAQIERTLQSDTRPDKVIRAEKIDRFSNMMVEAISGGDTAALQKILKSFGDDPAMLKSIVKTANEKLSSAYEANGHNRPLTTAAVNFTEGKGWSLTVTQADHVGKSSPYNVLNISADGQPFAIRHTPMAVSKQIEASSAVKNVKEHAYYTAFRPRN